MNSIKAGKTIWVLLITAFCLLTFSLLTQRQAVKAGIKETDQASATSPVEKTVPVKLTPVTSRHFQKTISAFGKVEARQTAFVSPRISGIIEKLFVDEGSEVIKGKTVLFEIDNLKLKQKVSNARQNLSIVLAVEKERKALLKKAEIDLDRKTRSFARYKALFDKQAITQEAFDANSADYQTAIAEVEHKQAILELGQAEAKQALINLQMVEKDLADSTAIAPIDGIISEKLVETGEMGQPGKPVFKIDNVADLEISAFVPAEFSPDIIQDKTIATLSVYGKILPDKLPISFKSPVVDPKLHIFEIKARIASNSTGLQPGQSVQLSLLINEHSAPAVPTAAMINDDKGSSLFILENNRVKKIAVNPGVESEGWTEILEPTLTAGTRIISEGQFLVKENSQISVIE